MVDVFVASSVNSMIYSDKNATIFNEITSNNLFEFRKKIRNNYETIIVGANTIKNDNPNLLNSDKSNIRIVIDKYGDLNINSKIFSNMPEKTYVILLKDKKEYVQLLNNMGVHVIELIDGTDEKIISTIKNISLGNILVEGGSKIIGMFLENKFIDNIIIVQFPIIFPDESVSLCRNIDSFINLRLKDNYIFDNKYIYSFYEVEK